MTARIEGFQLADATSTRRWFRSTKMFSRNVSCRSGQFLNGFGTSTQDVVDGFEKNLSGWEWWIGDAVGGCQAMMVIKNTCK